MNITLVKPTYDMKTQAIEFLNCFYSNNEDIINGSCGITRIKEYDDWVSYIEQVLQGLKDRVPSNTYFAINDKTNKIVGVIDIRHYLDEEHYYSGHIGYFVSPINRCNGYGSEILKQGLEKAKALHLEKILLTCKKDNVASSQVIMKNGGVLEKEYIEDGNVMLAYWIHIS